MPHLAGHFFYGKKDLSLDSHASATAETDGEADGGADGDTDTVDLFSLPFLKTTTPPVKAKSVWSLPRPTFLPG
jgi:hypothetical protein